MKLKLWSGGSELSNSLPYFKTRSDEAFDELEKLRRKLIKEKISKPYVDLVDYLTNASLEALSKLGLYYDIYTSMLASRAEYLAEKLTSIITGGLGEFRFLLLHGFSDIPQIDFSEELFGVMNLYGVFFGEPRFRIILLKVPRRYAGEISPWPLVAHELGHAVIIYSGYFEPIQDVINKKKISDDKKERETYSSYVQEVLADLIASTLITRSFATALETEFSRTLGTKEWGREHPPLSLRINIIRSAPSIAELEEKYQNDPKALKLLDVLNELENETKILTVLSREHRDKTSDIEEKVEDILRNINSINNETQVLLEVLITRKYSNPLEVIALAPALKKILKLRQLYRMLEELLLDTYRRLVVKQAYEGLVNDAHKRGINKTP